MEQSRQAEEAVGRLTFQRVRGTPMDVIFSGSWRQAKRDNNPFSEVSPLQERISRRFPERRQLSLELSYPLAERHTLGLGLTFQQNLLEREVEVYDILIDYDPVLDDFVFTNELVDIERSELEARLYPVSLSWLYRNLDRPTSPNNGVLATASIERYLDVADAEPSFVGTRVNTRLTTFKSFSRFLWFQRLEAGWYNRNVADFSQLIDDGLVEDSPPLQAGRRQHRARLQPQPGGALEHQRKSE